MIAVAERPSTGRLPERVAHPPERFLLIFDGSCPFCRRWARRFSRWTGPAVAYAPYQRVAPFFPDISLSVFESFVVAIEPSGRVFTGADAAARLVAARRGWRWALGAYRSIPGAAPFSRAAYRWVSRHRFQL